MGHPFIGRRRVVFVVGTLRVPLRVFRRRWLRAQPFVGKLGATNAVGRKPDDRFTGRATARRSVPAT